MSQPKRNHGEELDPDYEDFVGPERKRQRLIEEQGKAAMIEKVKTIIHRDFGLDINERTTQLLEIQSRLNEAQEKLNDLRHVVVTHHYMRAAAQVQEVGDSGTEQTRIHPAVKKLLGLRSKKSTTNRYNRKPDRAKSNESTIVHEPDGSIDSSKPKPSSTVTSTSSDLPSTSKGNTNVLDAITSDIPSTSRSTIIPIVENSKPSRTDSTRLLSTCFVSGSSSPIGSDIGKPVSPIVCPTRLPSKDLPFTIDHSTTPNQPAVVTESVIEDSQPQDIDDLDSKNVVRIPRYVPPIEKERQENCNKDRRLDRKILKRLLVGNMSRWLPMDTREDKASHKWMLYVRFIDNENASKYISKVRYLLHPSYKPNDVVDVRSAPFHLSRRGWGEFQVRVQVHFRHPADKPLDIRHDIKLDRTYTGMETLGSETHVKVWLHSVQFEGSSNVISDVVTRTIVHEAQLTIPSEKQDINSKYVTTENNIEEDGVADLDNSLRENTSAVVSSAESLLSIGDELSRKIKTEYEESSCDIEESVVEMPFSDMQDGSEFGMDMFLCDTNDDNINSLEIKEEIVETCEETFDVDDEAMEIDDLFNESTSTSEAASVKSEDNIADDDLASIVDEPSYNIVPASSTPGDTTKSLMMIKFLQPDGKFVYLTIDPKNVRKTNPSVIPSKSVIPSIQSVPNNALSNVPKPKSTLNQNGFKITPVQSNRGVENKLVQVVNPKLLQSRKLIPKSAATVLHNVERQESSGKNVPLALQTGRTVTKTNSPVSKMNPTSLLTNPSSLLMNIKKSVIINAQKRTVLSAASNASSLLRTSAISSPNVPVTIEKNQNAPIGSTVRDQAKSILLLNNGMVFGINVPKPLAQSNSELLMTNKTLCLIGDKKSKIHSMPSLLSPVRPPQNVANTKSGVSLLKPHSLLKPQYLTPMSTQANSETYGEQVGEVEKVRKQTAVSNVSTETTRSISAVKIESGTENNDEMYSCMMDEMRRGSMDDSSPLSSGRLMVIKKAQDRKLKHLDVLRYQAVLSQIQRRCGTEHGGMTHAVKLLVRHLPLVDASALDPHFKVVHPYCAPSTMVFLQWHPAKQRSAEWMRAKAVRDLLVASWPPGEVWTTREIALYARCHGYTPALGDAQLNVEGASADPTSTCSEPIDVAEWLARNPGTDVQTVDVVRDEEEVDVVNVMQTCRRVKTEEVEGYKGYMETMKMTHEMQFQCEYVSDNARDIGVSLKPEEIVPGMLYNSAERVILEAVKSFTDDLLRRSLCRAWDRNSNRPPEVITMSDVKAALSDREEFDMLTNSGLGTQPMDKG